MAIFTIIFILHQVHGVKKDDIQLQMAGGVLGDRGESNHSDSAK